MARKVLTKDHFHIHVAVILPVIVHWASDYSAGAEHVAEEIKRIQAVLANIVLYLQQFAPGNEGQLIPHRPRLYVTVEGFPTAALVRFVIENQHSF